MRLSRFGFLLLVHPFWLAVSSTCLEDGWVESTMLLQFSQSIPNATPEDDCHDVEEGDEEHKQCWKTIQWWKKIQQMKAGNYFHGLTLDSPLADFQIQISFCPTPCSLTSTAAALRIKKASGNAPEVPEQAEESKSFASAAPEQKERPSREPATLWDLASAPRLPKTPGCYAWMPSGCPKQEARLGADAFAKWRRDARGNESASACKARAAAQNHWCGSSDVQTTFVAPDPKTPGCWAWRPLGCPRQQLDVYDSWRGDERGRGGYGKCKNRSSALDHWCGSQGTRMHFVPEKSQAVPISPTAPKQAEKETREHAALENLLASAPALPKTPGCYAWMPSGCPKQEARLGADAFAKWRGDEKGKESASACKARAATLGTWCGSSDTQMTFVAWAPRAPGCYAWMPFGCPRQQLDKFDTWAADRNGKESFRACKERGAELDRWCGTKGTVMNFVQ